MVYATLILYTHTLIDFNFFKFNLTLNISGSISLYYKIPNYKLLDEPLRPVKIGFCQQIIPGNRFNLFVLHRNKNI